MPEVPLESSPAIHRWEYKGLASISPGGTVEKIVNVFLGHNTQRRPENQSVDAIRRSIQAVPAIVAENRKEPARRWRYPAQATVPMPRKLQVAEDHQGQVIATRMITGEILYRTQN